MHRKLFIILMLLGFAITVYAQADQQAQTGDKERKESFLYQWTDEKGVVHITDNRDKVPKAYRDKALKLTQSKSDDEEQVQQKSAAIEGVESEGADNADKAAWQQRMRNAKQRLANAETQYQVLTQRRNELLQSWGGPVSGRLDTRAEADSVEQEMRNVQKEIDAARQELEDIPNQARKAGIPPGWLRE